MIQVDRIVCLVAEWEPPPPGLAQALILADTLGARVLVVPAPPLAGTPDHTEALDEALDRFSGQTAAVPVTLDRPVSSVHDVRQRAAETEADLIVTGAPANASPQAPLTDAFTTELIEQLSRPLLIARPPSSCPSPSRVLVPVDFSAASSHAYAHATALAALHDAAVDVLHVIDANPYVALTPTDRLTLSSTTFPEQRARRRLANFLRGERPAEVSVRSQLAFGDPVRRISRAADACAVDLTVLSTQGADAPSDRPLGRVARGVLQRITGSVLLLGPGQTLLADPSAAA